MILNATDRQAIEARVAALESELGIEIVTVVTAKSDEYPEIVWKAFALGTSVCAFAVTLADVLRPDWATSGLVFTSVLLVLAAGVTCAVATIYVPAFARLFLRKSRAAAEVVQYANDRFLERELFATPQRTALLIVVSMLEHRVVILPDKGLRGHLTPARCDVVIARMTERLAAGATGAAVLAGLGAIAEALAGSNVARGAGNAFADAPIVVDREGT